MIELHLKVH